MLFYSVVNFKEIPQDGEQWELFTRDLLQEQGFFIESPPNRGADGGRDLLISERLMGNLGNYEFRWLVSCKHFAHSNRSVGISDEDNILERVRGFGADGFIGFYSTVPSSGLINRLEQLKAAQDIKDFRIFDSRHVEQILVRLGFDEILLRYFPISYDHIKPVHLVVDEYLPLACEKCGKDILKAPQEETLGGNLLWWSTFDQTGQKVHYGKHHETIHKVHVACKTPCTRELDELYKRLNNWSSSRSTELSYLHIPVHFLDFVFRKSEELRQGLTYDHEAFKSFKYIIASLSQKVFRFTTEEQARIYRNDKWILFPPHEVDE